jgi:hypothetical protein
MPSRVSAKDHQTTASRWGLHRPASNRHVGICVAHRLLSIVVAAVHTGMLHVPVMWCGDGAGW